MDKRLSQNKLRFASVTKKNVKRHKSLDSLQNRDDN